MEGSERDNTQDWLLPQSARPPLLSELEARIDDALATARSSEEAVMAVGAAALDAAEQARRAAGIAERAAATALDAQRHRAGPAGDESLRIFTERADRIAQRLRDLSPASVGAGR
ncbi:MAG TPA: hypothetical protein VF176_08675 [Solirubrobacterales bacterium]